MRYFPDKPIRFLRLASTSDSSADAASSAGKQKKFVGPGVFQVSEVIFMPLAA
jgi:hypothetical protein